MITKWERCRDSRSPKQSQVVRYQPGQSFRKHQEWPSLSWQEGETSWVNFWEKNGIFSSFFFVLGDGDSDGDGDGDVFFCRKRIFSEWEPMERRIQDYLDEQEQQACGSMATLKSCERRVEPGMYKRKQRWSTDAIWIYRLHVGSHISWIATYRRVNKSHGLVPEFCNWSKVCDTWPLCKSWWSSVWILRRKFRWSYWYVLHLSQWRHGRRIGGRLTS